jgi:hypothetical protein
VTLKQLLLEKGESEKPLLNWSPAPGDTASLVWKQAKVLWFEGLEYIVVVLKPQAESHPGESRVRLFIFDPDGNLLDRLDASVTHDRVLEASLLAQVDDRVMASGFILALTPFWSARRRVHAHLRSWGSLDWTDPNWKYMAEDQERQV